MSDNNILIKITSEADLNQAQKEIVNLTTKADDLTKQMADLKKQEEEEIDALKKQAKEWAGSTKVMGEFEKKIQDTQSKYKVLIDAKKAEQAENKKSAKTLADQVKAYKTLHGMTGRSVQQLRAMREELQRMEDAGEYGSQAFMDLAIKAGELEDKISDVQQRIRILANDTKELDAVMGLGDGLAGTFYIATSAAEVFGEDMEGLQQAFYKVQAAMSVVNGIQQVANFLNRESNFNVVVSTALLKKKTIATAADAVATGKATVAQRILNKVMMSNPAAIVLASLAALVAAYTVLSGVLQRVSDKQARLNKVTTENKLEDLRSWAEFRSQMLQAQNKSDLERAQFEKDVADQEVQIRKEALDKANELSEKSNIFTRSKRKEELEEAREAYKQALEEQQKAGDSLIVTRYTQTVNYEKELIQARLDLLREGQEKEIAQVKENYRERLRVITGNTKEEIELRKKLKEKERQEIADIEYKYFVQNAKAMTELDVALAEKATKELVGEANLGIRKKAWEEYYAALEYQMQENAALEIEEIKRSTDNEETKANKIKLVNAKLDNDIVDLKKQRNEKILDLDKEYLDELQRTVDEAETNVSLAVTTDDKLTALKAKRDAEIELYTAQRNELDKQYQAGLIEFKEYKQQEWEITKAITDAEVEYQRNAMQSLADGFQTALGYIQQASDVVFDALNVQVQAQLDELDKMYTTDYEEAQKNAEKKYISEKEYEKKKAALEEKQAKYAKAQALTNIAIQTALAIITTLAQLGATPWGIAAASIAGSLGAAQLAVAAAKPLAQYEKGRKGGKGEYAIVGEKGAELMYVPEGASIVPHDKIDKPAEWKKYGVPEIPHTDREVMRYAAEQVVYGQSIDYDLLGAAVAAALPKQSNVTVNVDRTGVHVSKDRNIHTYLNAKYNGSWH